MIIQCAWCLKMLGEKAPIKDKNITHGMCEQCMKDMIRKMEQKK